MFSCLFFVQAEDGIRDLVRSRGLGDVYKRQRRGCVELRAVAGEGIVANTAGIGRRPQGFPAGCGQRCVEGLGASILPSVTKALAVDPVSYTHLRAHETVLDLVCRLLLEKTTTNNETAHT